MAFFINERNTRRRRLAFGGGASGAFTGWWSVFLSERVVGREERARVDPSWMASVKPKRLTKGLLQKSHHTLEQRPCAHRLPLKAKSRGRKTVDAQTHAESVEKMDLNPREQAMKPGNAQLRRTAHHRFIPDSDLTADVTS